MIKMLELGFQAVSWLKGLSVMLAAAGAIIAIAIAGFQAVKNYGGLEVRQQVAVQSNHELVAELDRLISLIEMRDERITALETERVEVEEEIDKQTYFVEHGAGPCLDTTIPWGNYDEADDSGWTDLIPVK